MVIGIIPSKNKKSKSLVLTPFDLYDRNILKEIAKTGCYLNVKYDPYDKQTIIELTMPLFRAKKTA